MLGCVVVLRGPLCCLWWCRWATHSLRRGTRVLWMSTRTTECDTPIQAGWWEHQSANSCLCCDVLSTRVSGRHESARLWFRWTPFHKWDGWVRFPAPLLVLTLLQLMDAQLRNRIHTVRSTSFLHLRVSVQQPPPRLESNRLQDSIRCADWLLQLSATLAPNASLTLLFSSALPSFAAIAAGLAVRSSAVFWMSVRSADISSFNCFWVQMVSPLWIAYSWWVTLHDLLSRLCLNSWLVCEWQNRWSFWRKLLFIHTTIPRPRLSSWMPRYWQWDLSSQFASSALQLHRGIYVWWRRHDPLSWAQSLVCRRATWVCESCLTCWRQAWSTPVASVLLAVSHELCILLLSVHSYLRHALIELRNRFPHGLNVSVFAGQLILVILNRILVSNELTSWPHLLSLVETLDTIRLLVVVSNLFRLNQRHHYFDHFRLSLIDRQSCRWAPMCSPCCLGIGTSTMLKMYCAWRAFAVFWAVCSVWTCYCFTTGPSPSGTSAPLRSLSACSKRTTWSTRCINWFSDCELGPRVLSWAPRHLSTV